jgi:hypothetical protein
MPFMRLTYGGEPLANATRGSQILKRILTIIEIYRLEVDRVVIGQTAGIFSFEEGASYAV